MYSSNHFERAVLQLFLVLILFASPFYGILFGWWMLSIFAFLFSVVGTIILAIVAHREKRKFVRRFVSKIKKDLSFAIQISILLLPEAFVCLNYYMITFLHVLTLSTLVTSNLLAIQLESYTNNY